jgi:DNA polymerase elongation subunit (family B)
MICCDKLVQKIFGDKQDDKQKIVKFLDDVCKTQLTKVLEDSCNELFQYMNAYKQKIVFKREVIADKGIFTAKKHYILNMFRKENKKYDVPELKIMGIEAVRSSTPQVCRKAIIETLKLIMNSTEDKTTEFVSKFKSAFMKMSFEEVAFPRTCNNMDSYWDEATIWKKATPIHVKGALIHNNLLEKLKLTNKYQKIQDSDKIKFCTLMIPNPYNIPVISCSNELPKEFGLEDYLDLENQYQKSYMEPIKSILNTLNWQVEKESTLEGMFE